MTTSGLKILTRFATPKTEPVADLAERRLRGGVAAPRRLDHAEHRLDAALPVSAGRVQQGVLADLRLPAAARAAGAAPAVRVDHHVPDLAAVTAVPGHGAAAGDDAPRRPRVAVQVDDVVAAGRGAPGVLGPRGDGRRRCRP